MNSAQNVTYVRLSDVIIEFESERDLLSRSEMAVISFYQSLNPFPERFDLMGNNTRRIKYLHTLSPQLAHLF